MELACLHNYARMKACRDLPEARTPRLHSPRLIEWFSFHAHLRKRLHLQLQMVVRLGMNRGRNGINPGKMLSENFYREYFRYRVGILARTAQIRESISKHMLREFQHRYGHLGPPMNGLNEIVSLAYTQRDDFGKERSASLIS